MEAPRGLEFFLNHTLLKFENRQVDVGTFHAEVWNVGGIGRNLWERAVRMYESVSRESEESATRERPAIQEEGRETEEGTPVLILKSVEDSLSLSF